MKKLLALLTLLLFATSVFAASSATTSLGLEKNVYGVTYRKYTVAWTAHTDGSFDAYTLELPVRGGVTYVVTDPGATAPQDNYDIILHDGSFDGCDIMGGELSNRDSATAEQAMPKMGSAYGFRYVTGKPVLEITGNNVNGAVGEIHIYTEE